MAKVLVFRPSFDLATKYGNSWLGEIGDIAKNIGHNVLDITGAECTPQAFYDAMNNFQPDLIITVGHGNENNFSCQDRELVLTGCTNDQIMAGKQGFYLSCLVGQELLPSMVKKGAVSVLGFTSEFVWLINPDYLDNIPNDPYAKSFKDAVVESCRKLLSGSTWQQVYEGGVALFDKGIANWFESEDPMAGEIVAALTQDRDSMVVYGEKFIGPSGQVLGDVGGLISIPIGLLLLALGL